MTARRPRPARRPGASLVEFALLVSVFLLFLFGLFEYCRYLMVLHVSTNAARDAARLASVNVNNPDWVGTAVTSAPYSAARPAYRVSQATAAVRQRAGSGTAGGAVERSIEGFAVYVFPCDTAQLYADPPVLRPRAGSTGWNNATFGERIAVRISGTYHPVAVGLLMLPSEIPINVTVVCGSEG